MSYDLERPLDEMPRPQPPSPEPPAIGITVENKIIFEPVERPLPEPEIILCNPFYMDIRTNMLYDAAGVPNIGADFYLGKDFTVGFNWMYAWWSRNSRHRYWRLYGGDINARWFFGSKAKEKPLTGHHIGLNAQVFTYDFEFGGKGYMGGRPGGTIFDRSNFGVSIEYGYSLPITSRLNLDFSLALGYMGGKYVTYRPSHNGGYTWIDTRHFNWFGPTKAEVALVWMIGCDNKNNMNREK